MLMLAASPHMNRAPGGKAAAMGLLGERRISGGQWLALAAALLGWMFDGFEQGIVPLVARPALVDLLQLSADAPSAAGGVPEARSQAPRPVEEQVGFWNGVIGAAWLLGAA